jgi:hypothetical protein
MLVIACMVYPIELMIRSGPSFSKLDLSTTLANRIATTQKLGASIVKDAGDSVRKARLVIKNGAVIANNESDLLIRYLFRSKVPSTATNRIKTKMPY